MEPTKFMGGGCYDVRNGKTDADVGAVYRA